MASPKCLKICCAVTTIVLTLTCTLLMTLYFTTLKPKQPIITAHPIGLENIDFTISSLNVTIGFIVTIKNPNYGSFKFKNTTTNVDYHGVIIAEVPLEQQLVPARREINISTCADLMVYKLISSSYFIGDIVAGSLNMTSSAALHGEVSFLKIFKFHATAFSTCDISFWIQSKDVDTKCKSKIKL